jgi:hypothetical protein
MASDATKSAGSAATSAGEMGKALLDKAANGASAAEQSAYVNQVENGARSAQDAATQADTATRSIESIASATVGAGNEIAGLANTAATSAKTASTSATTAATAALDAATSAQSFVDGTASAGEANARFEASINAGTQAKTAAATADENIAKLAAALKITTTSVTLPTVTPVALNRSLSRSGDMMPPEVPTPSGPVSTGVATPENQGSSSDSASRGGDSGKEKSGSKYLNEWQWKIPKTAKIKPRNDIVDPSIIGFDIPRT